MEKLLKIMEDLRNPQTGCPWDKVQTFATLAPYTIEEAHEVVDAILRNNKKDIQEELGDLLLQVVFLSQIAREEGAFTFNDVVEGLSAKLIRRHPHVFGEVKVEKAEDVKHVWEAVKAKEKPAGQGFFAAVPAHFPPVQKAYKIQKYVAKVGFDWDNAKQVLNKVDEELEELKVEIAAGDKDKQEAELGDVIFALINLSRHLGINAEIALARTNEKFMNRFLQVEQVLKAQGLALEKATLPQMEEAWIRIKKIL